VDAFQNQLLEKAKPDKNSKTGGALSQIKIAKAAGQEIQDGGDPGALCDEGVGASGHFAGGKVCIEECKHVKEDGNPQQDPPPKFDASAARASKHRRQPYGGAQSNQEKNQCPDAARILAAIELSQPRQEEREQER